MKTKIARRTLASAAAAALVPSACSNGANTEDGGASGGGDAGASEEVTLSFAHVLAESQPWHQCGALAFQESAEGSGTGLTIDLFPAAQTHADTLEQLDAIDSGNLDITWATPAQLGTRLDTLSVFDAAYLFRDSEHMMTAIASEPAEELWEELRTEHGMRVIGAGYYGTRHLTSNSEVTTPEDMNGVKLRVLDAPLWLDNGVILGGDPTPVAFSELYLALQQGVVDAEENPLPVIKAQAFDEVQEYVHLTGHVVAMMALVISDEKWDTLSPEQQDAVLEAGQALSDGVTKCTLDEEEQLLGEWSADGSPIQINDSVDLDAFRANAESVLFPKYEEDWGEIYRSLQEIE